MNPWTSVQVSNADHARTGQAGTVRQTSEDRAQVLVVFDIDGAAEWVAVADLKAL